MTRKHVLVVGGTRGTGRIVVRTFAKAKHLVSVIGRRSPSAADQRMPNTDYRVVDISDRKRLAAALEEILANNGKLNYVVFFQRFRGDGDAWTGEVATSLTATKDIIELLADGFRDSTDKAIVVIGSVASELIADEQSIGYHVAKAGLLQMVRYYAVVLGAGGIRVNCVSPGTVLKEESADFYLQNAELQRLYKAIIPLRRMGTSQEIASVVEFLCSPKASFVTGQNIVVDGGLSLQWHEALARRITSLKQRNVTREMAISIK